MQILVILMFLLDCLILGFSHTHKQETLLAIIILLNRNSAFQISKIRPKFRWRAHTGFLHSIKYNILFANKPLPLNCLTFIFGRRHLIRSVP